MNDRLQQAQDRLKLVQLMDDQIPTENQDRDQMRQLLELTKSDIKLALEEMGRVEDLASWRFSDDE